MASCGSLGFRSFHFRACPKVPNHGLLFGSCGQSGLVLKVRQSPQRAARLLRLFQAPPCERVPAAPVAVAGAVGRYGFHSLICHRRERRIASGCFVGDTAFLHTCRVCSGLHHSTFAGCSYGCECQKDRAYTVDQMAPHGCKKTRRESTE